MGLRLCKRCEELVTDEVGEITPFGGALLPQQCLRLAFGKLGRTQQLSKHDRERGHLVHVCGQMWVTQPWQGEGPSGAQSLHRAAVRGPRDLRMMFPTL